MAANTRAIKAGEAFLEFSLSSKAFERQLRRMEARLRRFGMNLTKIGAAMVGAGTSILSAFILPTKFASDLENTVAEFEVLTGSLEDAKRIISELEQFSKISLISVKVLQESTRTLLGYGVAAADIVPVVKALAEISRGSADRMNRLSLAFGQTEAKTRLYAQEVRQFVESGLNPLQQIAQKTGETMEQVQDRMTAGAISAAEVRDALIGATQAGGRFHGLLDRMSKTATGLFAKLRASVILAVRPIGQELLPIIKRVLAATINLLPPVEKWIKANTKLFLGVAAIGVALVVVGASLIALGLTITATIAAVKILFSSFVIISAAVVAGIAALIRYTAVGRQTARLLADAFGGLARFAMKSLGAISKALAAGEIQAAADVLWASLNVVWITGTSSLMRVWDDANAFYVQSWTKVAEFLNSIWRGVQVAFIEIVAGMKDAWSELMFFLSTGLNKATSNASHNLLGLLKQVMELAHADDPSYTFDISNELDQVNKDEAARQAVIDADRSKALSATESQLQKNLSAINAFSDAFREDLQRRRELAEQQGNKRSAEALRELDKALEVWRQAVEAAEAAGGNLGTLDEAAAEVAKAFGLGGGGSTVSAGITNSAAFQSLTGGPTDGLLGVNQQQLGVLKKIEKKKGLVFGA